MVRVGEQKGAILTYEEEDYPEQLREIFDPPPVLWVLGDVKLLARPSIAIVGTRHPTPYGTGMAEILARDLASRRMVILSGMARGIDTAAHRGALAAGGSTVAVWGTGIDVIYPKENKSLAENILVAGGAIVSEYRLGTFPAPQNFPRRNRIIEWHQHRRAGGGSGREQRHPGDRALRAGAGSRCLRGAGQRDHQERLGTQHVD